jgi:hypothetical protein
MQQPQQPSNVPAFYTLDQLPPNERFVKLLPHQANDIMEQLEMQVGDSVGGIPSGRGKQEDLPFG